MRKGKFQNTVTFFTLSLFVFLLLWLPLPSLPAAAQEVEAAPGTGILKGFIYKKNVKKRLWGAQVLLKNVKTGKMFESNVTDAIGDYVIRNLPAGDYRVFIMVKNRSYKIKKIDFLIKIFAGKTTTISFSLKKSRKLLFFFFLKPCQLVAFIAGIVAIVCRIKK